MKNYKRIASIIAIVAMLFTLINVNVFAADAAKYTFKVNDIADNGSFILKDSLTALNIDVYLSKADGGDVVITGIAGLDLKYPDIVSDISWQANADVETGEWSFAKEDGYVSIYLESNQKAVTLSASKKLGTFVVTLDKTKITADTAYEFKADATNDNVFVDPDYTLDASTMKFVATFSDALKITGVKTAPADITNKVYGTAQEDLGLPTTIKTTTVKQAGGAAGADTDLNVAWSGYDPYAKGEQTLTGTLTAPTGMEDGIDINGITASVKVTLQPIAYAPTAAIATADVKALKEDDTTDEAGITAKVKEVLADKNKIALTVKDGATEEEKITDEITVDWANATVAWDASGNIKTVGSTATVTYTFAADTNSTKGYYKAASGTAVTAKVTVVKAEIEGGSISINNPIDNGYITANVTVPVGQFKAGDKIAVKVLANGTEVYRYEQAIPDDVDLAKDYSTSIKLDKKMKELGFSSSDSSKKTFSVGVEVAGTELKNGTGDDATTTVTGEVKKATSGNAGGIHKGGSTTTTYAVTVVETKNGTATVSPEKAASGATVTVKAEPAEGYKVKSVTAVKADGTNVPVDEKALTFTMPASAVKVTVEFEEGKDEPSVDPTPAEDKFVDVADDFWAAKDIYTLKDAGIIGGKSATEFDPEGDVTRAEFAKMVVGLFGYKATSDAVNFEDCKAEDWFTPYVAAGVEAGVIKGVSDTEFAPNATITREDACTILGRALNKVAQSNELKFTDADKVAEYAAPYVALLSELGYVNGYEDGSFAPTNNITRAEAAKIIAGIYNAKNTTVTEDKTDAADTTDANVEGENTTAPVEENAEDKADTTDTIDVAPEK